MGSSDGRHAAARYRVVVMGQEGCLTTRVETLPGRLAALDKLARGWPDQRHHECEVLERVMAASGVEDVAEQVLSFEEIPDLV